MGVARCRVYAVDEARCCAAELIEHDLDHAGPVPEPETKIAARAKPFIETEAIRIQAMATIELEAGSAIEVGGSDAARLLPIDDSSSTRALDQHRGSL